MKQFPFRSVFWIASYECALFGDQRCFDFGTLSALSTDAAAAGGWFVALVEGFVASMSREAFRSGVRFALFLVLVTVGAVVIYRGNTFADPHGLSFVVPLMCTFTGILVMLTGYSLAYDRTDTRAA